MSESSTTTSSPVSRKGRNILVSSLVERIGSKNTERKDIKRQNYDRIVDKDLERGMSLQGGERTSPIRTTAENSGIDCIDNSHDDHGEDSGHDEPLALELPSRTPLGSIPSNFICPLTLLVMDDPVQDSCGHTFERRAILEWLERSHHDEAVCPISQKPLVPLGDNGMMTPTGNHEIDLELNNTAESCPCGYDRVLQRNESLQQRIQEWKLKHPLYQGVDAHYAQHQKQKMIRRNTIEMDDILERQEIPYRDDISSSLGNAENSHHRLSRFELMLLPQEREALKSRKEECNREREQLRRRNMCILLGVITFFTCVVSYWLGILLLPSSI